MIDAIRIAFKQNLPSLKWMDEKTRKAAEEKVLKRYNETVIWCKEWLLHLQLISRFLQRYFFKEIFYMWRIFLQRNSSKKLSYKWQERNLKCTVFPAECKFDEFIFVLYRDFPLTQADAVVDMIGFPSYILDPTKLDDKYKEVSCNTHIICPIKIS